jgi:hypothetical protein
VSGEQITVTHKELAAVASLPAGAREQIGRALFDAIEVSETVLYGSRFVKMSRAEVLGVYYANPRVAEAACRHRLRAPAHPGRPGCPGPRDAPCPVRQRGQVTPARAGKGLGDTSPSVPASSVSSPPV